MEKIINHRNKMLAVIMVLSAGIFFGCKKYDVKGLGPKPVASFTVTPVTGAVNKYLLTNTSTNSFMCDWDKGTGAFYRGLQVDTVYFPDRGDYTIRLWTYGQSGIDTTSKVISVANDDPAALTPIKMLTNNSSRKWKLAPEAGALYIGPPDFSATWWQNSVGDVTARACLFNDVYTFTKVGQTMKFESQGDFYVDEEGGNPHPAGMPSPVGCYANSAIPVQFQPWANDGMFTFEVINNNKLKVNGLGAHLGLYKAANPPDAAVGTPQSTITYDIVSITPSRMVLKIDYGWGAWRFTYVSF